MFDSIWKDQIQKPKSGATIWQPKEKMKPDKGRDCCQEAKDKIVSFFGSIILFRLPSDFTLIENTIQKKQCEKVRIWLEHAVGDGNLPPSISPFNTILKEWEECENV